MNKLQLIWDADVLLYQSTLAAEQEVCWGNDIWTLHSDLSDAKREFQQRIQSITNKCLTAMNYKGDYENTMCLSDSTNFRKEIFEDYKGSRKGKRKPLAYLPLKQWVTENYKTVCYANLEGDDSCNITAQSHELHCILSIDKDFMACQCTYFNFNFTKENPNGTLYTIDAKTAQFNHFMQTLTGDVADSYPGAKGIGKVTAEKALSKDCSWEAVVKLYASKGLTEADALVQARVAKILTADLWNAETSEVILWQPKSVCECSNECQESGGRYNEFQSRTTYHRSSQWV